MDLRKVPKPPQGAVHDISAHARLDDCIDDCIAASDGRELHPRGWGSGRRRGRVEVTQGDARASGHLTLGHSDTHPRRLAAAPPSRHGDTTDIRIPYFQCLRVRNGHRCCRVGDVVPFWRASHRPCGAVAAPATRRPLGAAPPLPPLWLDCDREGENICYEVLRTAAPALAPRFDGGHGGDPMDPHE
eukprot:gene1208-biopygen1374